MHIMKAHGPQINGIALRAVRQIRGLTLRELAEQAGLDRTTVNSIELERRNPSWPCLERIATVLAFPAAGFLRSPDAQAANRPARNRRAA